VRLRAHCPRPSSCWTPQTGVLTGTPIHPGASIPTTQLARALGERADVRDYVLVVRGTAE